MKELEVKQKQLEEVKQFLSTEESKACEHEQPTARISDPIDVHFLSNIEQVQSVIDLEKKSLDESGARRKTSCEDLKGEGLGAEDAENRSGTTKNKPKRRSS